MDIESLVVGGGPLASLVVLRSQGSGEDGMAAQLPIQIGSFEASAISMGVAPRESGRPMTCVSVRISDVKGTTFYAQVELMREDGRQVLVDARPSDAIALAVREEVPVFAEESVLQTASLPDFRGVERDEQERELAQFHNFVETLSPEDFTVTHEEPDGE